jgi:2-(1,2-epoxy-1,2-dihydrophenyl)acetyl-CoA isomerase
MRAMDGLQVEREAGIVTLTLARPERRNALDVPLWRALAAQLAEIETRAADRVLVLTGAGGVFCAGGDLSPGAPEPDSTHSGAALAVVRSSVQAVALALHRLSKPTLAAVDGVAAGAGANLALGCDLVLASERARFGQVFVERALPLDCGGTWLLPRLIGLQKAKELAFFGDWIGAEEARALGLVNRVVAADQLMHEARTWALRLAEKSPAALAFIKAGLNRSFETAHAQALDDEAAALTWCTRTPEAAQAVERFFARRRADG